MADIVNAETRSKMMSGIRSKNTKPELVIRYGLHALGLRYRIHDHKLYGKPDLVFPRYKTVVFVHGCFWHGHNCHLFKLPSTNSSFWETKISKNKFNDKKNIDLLLVAGWKVIVVWECVLKRSKLIPSVILHLAETIKLGFDGNFIELTSTKMTPGEELSNGRKLRTMSTKG
jgi:DNA mismatch endonuclease, patch repair protein